MTTFIDANRQKFGIEPLRRVLPIVPSTYHGVKVRPPPARARPREALIQRITRVHKARYGVYGVRKVWQQLTREGMPVARGSVGRLMQKWP
jgi:putative transposase